MRFVDRSAVAPPSYLSGPEAGQSRRAFLDLLRLDLKERAQTRVPDRHLPEDPSIRSALETLFLGKCAFCESRAATGIYRFRPTSDAEPRTRDPMAHLAYGWLADAWQNLYPICRACRPARPNHFPVEGRRLQPPSWDAYAVYVRANDGLWPGYPLEERALLLDPCEVRKLGDHILPFMDGALRARSRQGEETIAHFRLNRSELAERRAMAFAEFDAAEESWASPPGPEAPFSGLWRTLKEVESFTLLPVPRPRSRVEQAPSVAETAATIPPKLIRIELENFKALEALGIDMPAGDEPEGLARALLILARTRPARARSSKPRHSPCWTTRRARRLARSPESSCSIRASWDRRD